MDERRTDAPEQLEVTSTNGKAEPTNAVQVQIYPDPEPPRPYCTTTTTTTTLFKWTNRLQKQPEERPKQGKIHEVPGLIQAKLNSSNDYQPKVVSLGPYHFGEGGLKISRKAKKTMAERLVPDKELEDSLRFEIKENIVNLMDVYSSDKMKTDEHIVWEEMFFLDGCFVLHFIFCIMFNRVEDMEMERDEIDAVHSDLFLAENQLPFKLLQILSGNDPELLDLVDDYIHTHKISNDISWDGWKDEPVHLLDHLRTIIIGGRSDTNKCQSTPPPVTKGTKSIVLRNAKELTAKGIHLKPNRTGFLKEIFFRPHCIYGTLRLPRIIVDDSTRLLFLNLAAYEMRAEVGSTITSYICFLDSLVNHADDIKELQSAGVLVNHLATDEAAANLFNEMSQGLHPNPDAYMDVKKKIKKFFGNKTKASIASWIAEGYHNHFKSPLTAMAVLAASLALGLAATQTYFTIFPGGNN